MNAVRFAWRRSWPVLAAYAAFTLWGLGCMVLSMAVDGAGVTVIAGVTVASLVGYVLGALLGLCGLRVTPVLVVLVTMPILTALIGLGGITVFVALATFCALSGYLGIASRIDIAAAWGPLSYCVGGVILWINQGRAGAWYGNNKHAVWDAYTLIALSGGVFTMLLFLVTRNGLRLTACQQIARRAEASTTNPAKPGRGSILALLLFSVLVLGATSLLSPYLFHTSEAQEGMRGDSQGDERGEGQGEGQNGADTNPSEGRTGNAGGAERGGNGGASKNQGRGRANGENQSEGQGGDGKSQGNQPDTSGVGEALRDGSNLLMWVLLFVLLLLILIALIGPPLRRAMLLRHLERPLWPVSPTTRVRNLWQWTLAHLALFELAPQAGETTRDFAQRASTQLAGLPQLEALNVAASIVENIEFGGRGLGPHDEANLRNATIALVRQLRLRATFSKRVTAAYGPALEVD